MGRMGPARAAARPARRRRVEGRPPRHRVGLGGGTLEAAELPMTDLVGNPVATLHARCKLACLAGSVSEVGGATRCDACAAGKRSNATASTSCEDCDAGRLSAAGASGGLSAQYSSPTSAVSVSCPRGRVVHFNPSA